MKQRRLPIFKEPHSYFNFEAARQALSRLVYLAKATEAQTLAVVFDGPKAGKTCFLKQAFHVLAEENLLAKVTLLEINTQTNIGSFIDTFDTLRRKNRSVVVALDENIKDKAIRTRLYDSESIYFSVTEEELKEYVFFFSRSCFFKITLSSFRRVYPFLDRKLSIWNQFLISLATHCSRPSELKNLLTAV